MKRFWPVVLAVAFLGLVFIPGTSSANLYKPPGQRSLSVRPDTDPLVYLSAFDRLAVGDTHGALKRARRATETFPYHRPSVLLRHRLLADYVGADTADEWIRDHLQRTRDGRILNALLSDTDAVSERVARLIRWSYEDGLYTRGSLLFLARRELEATAYERIGPVLKTGIESYPSDVDFLYFQARVLARQGQCGRAQELVRQLLNRAEGRADLYLLMARLLRDETPEDAQFYYGRYTGLLEGSDHQAESLQKRVYSCVSG